MENYADTLDLASEIEQKRLEVAVAAALADKEEQLPAIGRCHYCDEPVVSMARFCDEFCRDDYDYLKARRKANAL